MRLVRCCNVNFKYVCFSSTRATRWLPPVRTRRARMTKARMLSSLRSPTWNSTRRRRTAASLSRSRDHETITFKMILSRVFVSRSGPTRWERCEPCFQGVCSKWLSWNSPTIYSEVQEALPTLGRQWLLAIWI